MNYSVVFALRNSNDSLRRKVSIAVVKAAIDVLAEAVDTPNHALRGEWAIKTLNDPPAMAETMLWGIVVSPGFQSLFGDISEDEAAKLDVLNTKMSDDDLQFTVNALVDAYAGVTEAK